jgi:hypothetical protein
MDDLSVCQEDIVPIALGADCCLNIPRQQIQCRALLRWGWSLA